MANQHMTQEELATLQRWGRNALIERDPLDSEADADEVLQIALAARARKKKVTEGFSPDEPRYDHGRWTSDGGGGGGEGFASPNTQEGLNYAQAVAKLDSSEERDFVRWADKVAKAVDTGEARPAIGDWSDGAENSTVIDAQKVNSEQMRYMMAVLGKARDQKAVVSFLDQSGGPDTLYHMTVNDQANNVRVALDKAGIQFRTLELTGAKQTTVHIFDPGSSLREAIKKVAIDYGTKVQTRSGNGEFIGGDTREEGRAAYQKIIDSYEQKHGRVSF